MKGIDLFAGAGGFTTGATQAGVDVVWAANHWKVAVDTHEANHPYAQHLCQDLAQADWRAVPAHDLLMASPACQGHSPARGKEKPHHDALRSTAWAVADALEYHRPEFGLVENVPSFISWALYPAWCMALQALGYSVSPHLVNSADHGVPQDRERLLIVLTRTKAPLVLNVPKKPQVAASSFVRFDDECRWSLVDKPGRAAATLARIRRGRAELGRRFIMPYYGGGSGLTGRSLDRPVGTITTRDRWAVVDGDRMRMFTADENRIAMGFPDGYKLPANHKLAVHMLGNAVTPPMVRDYITALREQA